MRTALLSLSLLLAACEEHVNLTEFSNLSAQTIGDRERLLAVERTVGKPVTDPMVASLADQVAALKAENAALAAKVAATSKVPHLINSATAKDLGTWHGGAVSYSPQYHSPVNWGVVTLPIYHSSDCTGDAVVIVGVDPMVPGTIIFDKNGGAIRYDGLRLASGASRLVGDVCSEVGGFGDESLRPSGTLLGDGEAAPELRLLSVELR